MSKATVTEIPIVTVDLRFHDGRLKVTWNDGGMDYEQYFVDAARLERLGRRARDRLVPLVERARSGQLAGVGPDLRSLAEAGHELFQALFITASGSGVEADIVRDDLARRRQPFRLLVKVDQRVHVPWGLIYDAEPDPRSQSATIDDFRDFWCVKYLLSTVHHRVPPRPRTRDREDFKVIPVLNKASFEAALAAIDDEEKAVIDNLIGAAAQPVYSSAELLRRWRSSSREVGLIYFYCHANGTSLALSVSDELDIDRLALMSAARDRAQRESCLFFLNGCGTAIGGPGGGFLEATVHPGFCGFIGTEAKVPDVFALRFGAAFLHEFLHSGQPLYQVMAGLRRQHWPLSLLYGIYGHPLLQLDARPSISALPRALQSNFSQNNVGSREMAAELRR